MAVGWRGQSNAQSGRSKPQCELNYHPFHPLAPPPFPKKGRDAVGANYTSPPPLPRSLPIKIVVTIRSSAGVHSSCSAECHKGRGGLSVTGRGSAQLFSRSLHKRGEKKTLSAPLRRYDTNNRPFTAQDGHTPLYGLFIVRVSPLTILSPQRQQRKIQ